MGHDEKIEPRRLKGFRDYLPPVMAGRYRIIDAVRETARLAGFQPVGTPALEYADILLGQGGDETDKQVYRFHDHGDRAVALRFDLTVPFARFVAEHQAQLSFPFKRVQIGDVWRGENTQKGRYREFGQCDLDIIGVDSGAADIEILLTFTRLLKAVAFGPFTVAIGHRLLLSALIRQTLGSTTASTETQALIALDKLAKIGGEKVHQLLAQIPGATAAGATQLLTELGRKTSRGDSDLAALSQLLAGDPLALSQIERLQQTVALLTEFEGAERASFRLDLSIARGLGYYTGIVFETTIDALPGFGSICSGGRYNDLASRFSNRQLPGVGGSVGLDRLLSAMEELKQLPATTGADVFVAVATPDAEKYAWRLVSKLRAANITCDVGLGGKLGAQFKHADRLGCAYVITVGTDEVTSQTVALKNMRQGTEERGLDFAALLCQLTIGLRLG